MKSTLTKTQSNNSGQILVMVLVVMMILSIIVVTVTNNSVRDIQQSSYTSQYEDLYATSEKFVLDLGKTLETRGNTQVNTVTEVFTDLGYTNVECEPGSDPEYPGIEYVECTIEEDTSNGLTNDPTDRISKIRVKDSPHLENVEVLQDEYITYKVTNGTGFNPGDFEIWWTGADSKQVAIEIAFDFKYVDHNDITQYSTVRSAFNKNVAPVFALNSYNNNFFGGFNTLQNRPNYFTFEYSVLEENIKANYTDLHLIKDSSDIIPVAFRFKPYITSDNPANENGNNSITLNVITTNPQPGNQTRMIEATTYDIRQNEIFGAQPFVGASFPLNKTPAIFDYILRSELNIVHE